MAKKEFIIWHISDLHFPNQVSFEEASGKGKTTKTLEDLITELWNSFRKYRPNLIVITGDIIDRGNRSTYLYTNHKKSNVLDSFLDKLEDLVPKCKIDRRQVPGIVVVPGNHDINRDANLNDRFGAFDAYFRKRNYITEKTPCHYFNEHNIFLYCFNSCYELGGIRKGLPEKIIKELERATSGYFPTAEKRKQFLEYSKRVFAETLKDEDLIDGGFISDNLYDIRRNIHSELSRDQLEDTIGIAVLHHHVLPHLNPDLKTYEMVSNAGKFLGLLNQLGFGIILHGHKHSAFRSSFELENLRYDAAKSSLRIQSVIMNFLQWGRGRSRKEVLSPVFLI